MRRRTYPTGRHAIQDVWFWARLAIRAGVRRAVAALVSSPARILLTGAGLFLLFNAVTRRSTAVPEEQRALVMTLAGVVLVGFGLRSWWQRAHESPDASPWIILGGHPTARDVRAVVAQSSLSAVVLAVIPSGLTGVPRALHVLVTWTAVMSAWGAGVVAVEVLRRRRIRAAARTAAAVTTPMQSLMAERVSFVGVRTIATRLMMRAMAGPIVQLLGFAALVGALLLGIRQQEGTLPAALASGVLVSVLVVGFAFQFRRLVGPQHAFLFLHRPAPASDVWTAMAYGQCLVAAATVTATAALLLLPAWRHESGVTVWIAMLVEWSVYVVLAAYVFSPAERDDDLPRRLGVVAIAAGAALMVVVKAVVLTTLLTRWVAPIQSALSAVLVVRQFANAPRYLYSSRAPWRIFE